jgi:hypothetical protein
MRKAGGMGVNREKNLLLGPGVCSHVPAPKANLASGLYRGGGSRWMFCDSQNMGEMFLALNKAFLYLNCQPRIFRKVSPSVTECVCTKNYPPVYKHSWMQKHGCVRKAPEAGTQPHCPRATRSSACTCWPCPAHPECGVAG